MTDTKESTQGTGVSSLKVLFPGIVLLDEMEATKRQVDV